jgi:hypothetical protein
MMLGRVEIGELTNPIQTSPACSNFLEAGRRRRQQLLGPRRSGNEPALMPNPSGVTQCLRWRRDQETAEASARASAAALRL